MYVKRRRGWRARQSAGGYDGFTLIELVICVAIVALISFALTGMVISYLSTANATSARLTESDDVQFAAAYWQRDVASLGVRSPTYDPSDTVHSYPLMPSVNVGHSCMLPSGTPVATLAWSSYVVTSPDTPTTITVIYVAQLSGSRYQLLRVHCTGTAATPDSTITVARNLTILPVLGCPTAADSCTGAGASVPRVVTLTLTSSDPNNNDGSTYTATLTGERRVT